MMKNVVYLKLWTRVSNQRKITLTQSFHISGCKLSIYFAQKKKNYFFYFTHQFLQNTHISLSILHIYSIKYSLFYYFLLFSHSLPLSLSQTQAPSSSLSRSANRPNHHHHYHSITPHLATIITHPTSIIKENQPIQAETHSI